MWLLPFIVIFAGAFGVVRFAKISGRKASAGFLWFLGIVIPFVCQFLAARVLHPNELGVTKFDWFLIDNFHMQLSDAQYLTDVVCRIIGAAIGIGIVAIYTFVGDRKTS